MIKTIYNGFCFGDSNGFWAFIVMNESDADEYIKQPHNLGTSFVSITKANGYNIDFSKSYDHIDYITLKFDDCTTDIEGTCITREQATDIVKFILKFKDVTQEFCFNCSAGVSRSVAVCAAAMRMLCNDDSPIFKDSYFCPNMTVYREILNAWIDIISDKNEQTSLDHWNFYDVE